MKAPTARPASRDRARIPRTSCHRIPTAPSPSAFYALHAGLYDLGERSRARRRCRGRSRTAAPGRRSRRGGSRPDDRPAAAAARHLGPAHPEPARADVARGDPALGHQNESGSDRVEPLHHLDQRVRDGAPDSKFERPSASGGDELAARVDDHLGSRRGARRSPRRASANSCSRVPGSRSRGDGHLHAVHPIQRERLLELARRRLHVRADQHEPVPLARPLAVESLGARIVGPVIPPRTRTNDGPQR